MFQADVDFDTPIYLNNFDIAQTLTLNLRCFVCTVNY